MPSIRISQLPQAFALTGTERLAAAQTGATVSLSATQIGDFGARRSAPLAIGQVASRCYFHRAGAATPKQCMARTFHRATDDITALQIMEANWQGGNGTETAPGGASTIVASIEYPLDICHRITWADQPSGTVADGQNLLSDMMPIVIPAGGWFAIRRYLTNPAGIVFATIADGADAGFGPDVFGYASSGIVDQTMSGVPVTAQQAPGFCSYPAAILARTRRPSFGIIGDSRSAGALTSSADCAFNSSGDSGEIARAIGDARFGCINGGLFGTTLQQFVASHARQAEALSYCSHIVIQRSINDVVGGRTVAQIIADLRTIAGYFPRAQLILSTSGPVSASTDGWKTIASQTPHASNAARTALNAWKRQIPAPFSDCWELSDSLESARGSGLWQPGLTGDGTHQSAVGYSLVENLPDWAPRAAECRR